MAGATKVGSEFLINTTTRGAQIDSDVAALADGGFVVSFMSPSIKVDNTFGANEIYGQIFGADYQAEGDEFVIVDQPAASQINDQFAAVAALDDGFVAVWNAPFDDSPSSIMVDEFGADGSGTGGASEVSPGTNTFHLPDVATSTSGNYLVVWSDAGQSATDTSGSAILAKVNGTGALITIDTTTAGDQSVPTVAALQDGSGKFVVTWRSVDPSTSEVDIKAQIVSATGAKIGGEITVADDVGVGEETQVTATADGGFAIAYFDGYTIRCRVYDANGVPLDVDFAVSEPTPGGAYAADAAGLSNGLIAVTYENFSDFSSMYVKTFAPDGTQVGSTLTFNANDGGGGASYAGQPSIAALEDGDFVITWTDTSNDFEGAEPEPISAIVGQVYSSVAPVFIDGTSASNTFNGVTQTGFFLGYGGTDLVSYATAGAGVTVNMANPLANTGAAAGDEFGITIEGIIGSNFTDSITGNSGANLLSGGGGNDTLDGGAGVDTADYRDKSAAVAVTLNGATNATVTVGGVAEDTIRNIENVYGGSGADTLSGDGFANVFAGGNGDDLLKGGLGADTLNGQGGVDTADYRDKSASVVVTLNGGSDATVTVAGAAEDTIRSIENVFGGSGADTLSGDGFANVLAGGDGDDLLKGGNGADTLSGQGGVDTADYRDKTASVVVTLNGGSDATVTVAGAAEDTIRSIENVFGGSGADTLSGDGFANALYGGDGDDLLKGGNGADFLSGQGGVDKSASVAVTLNGSSNTTVTVGGVAEDTISKIENVYGGSGGDTLSGDSLANGLYGGGGNDLLNGGQGIDLLSGQAGADTFLFNTALNAATNLDHVKDFATEDTIDLENGIFASLTTTGTLSANAFYSAAGATSAHDSSDRIVYNTTTGVLYYDADGNQAGGVATVQFAVLDNHAALTNADFVVV